MIRRTFSFLLCLTLLCGLSGCVSLFDSFSEIETVEETTRYYIREADGTAKDLTAKLITATAKDAVTLKPTVPTAEEAKNYYAYAALNAEQKRIYCLLNTAAKKMTVGLIDLQRCEKSYADDITAAYQALQFDRPDYFWLSNAYLLSNIGSERRPRMLLAFQYKGDGHNCSYLVASESRRAMEIVLSMRIDDIRKGAADLTDPQELLLYLHDTLCHDVTYANDSDDPLIYTAYGALINNTAVCEGYSRALQLLCREFGIPCRLIVGIADNIGHMWNLADTGNGWCHTDVTWDDGSEELSRTYFNRNDAVFAVDHTVSPLFTKKESLQENGSFNFYEVRCTAADCDYFTANGLLYEEDDPAAVARLIRDANANGEKFLQLRIPDAEFLAAFSADYDGYLAHVQRQLFRLAPLHSVRLESVAVINDTVMIFWK